MDDGGVILFYFANQNFCVSATRDCTLAVEIYKCLALVTVIAITLVEYKDWYGVQKTHAHWKRVETSRVAIW